MRPAVFVDRDGVINKLVADPVTGEPESPLRVGEVALLPGAATALRRLAGEGWLLVGISNQPAAAKGLVGLEQLKAVQQRVLALLEAEGVAFDSFHICWHHPAGVVAELSGECECRKPAPGLLLAAARELGIDLERSWMIGDTDSDVFAGRAAGCRTVLIENPESAHKRGANAPAEVRVPTIDAAAETIAQRT